MKESWRVRSHALGWSVHGFYFVLHHPVRLLFIPSFCFELFSCLAEIVYTFDSVLCLRTGYPPPNPEWSRSYLVGSRLSMWVQLLDLEESRKRWQHILYSTKHRQTHFLTSRWSAVNQVRGGLHPGQVTHMMITHTHTQVTGSQSDCGGKGTFYHLHDTTTCDKHR